MQWPAPAGRSPLEDIKPQSVARTSHPTASRASIFALAADAPPRWKPGAAMKTLLLLLLALALEPALSAATGQPGTLDVTSGSARWELQGNAKFATYRGRRCLQLDGGAALLKDFELADGVIDVDVATSAARGFFGIQFRLDDSGANGEFVYLRQHKSGQPDAMQYTPVLNTGLNWQLYSGPGFTGRVDIARDAWFHLRLVVTGAQARLYVKDMNQPALVMSDLKSGLRKGRLALYVLTGTTCFANFTVRPTPDAPWERRLPPMPAGTLTNWGLSPAFDALERRLEQPLSPAEIDALPWQDVTAEAPGIVPINRYRESPHPRVSFANDFARRLEPQPGMKLSLIHI